MLRVTLTPDQRDAVQALRRDPSLTPGERDRVEMLLLSVAGWSPPGIAAHLGCHPATVRKVLTRFTESGPASVRRARPGPPPDRARHEQVEAALNRLLDQVRTWTAAQLAAALAEAGIHLSTRQTRKYLGRLGANWRRTVRTLHHKQDPAKVEPAKIVLDSLKKKLLSVAFGSSTSMSAASAPASR